MTLMMRMTRKTTTMISCNEESMELSKTMKKTQLTLIMTTVIITLITMRTLKIILCYLCMHRQCQ